MWLCLSLSWPWMAPSSLHYRGGHVSCPVSLSLELFCLMSLTVLREHRPFILYVGWPPVTIPIQFSLQADWGVTAESWEADPSCHWWCSPWPLNKVGICNGKSPLKKLSLMSILWRAVLIEQYLFLIRLLPVALASTGKSCPCQLSWRQLSDP